MKKIVAGIGVAALLMVAGFFAFQMLDSDDESASPEPSVSESPEASATPTPLVLPTASLPPGADDARLLMEINQVIFQVTQEAAQRPSDQRMTAEEINELIRSRIEEIRARHQKGG
jgi:hypothetical protein